MYGFMVSIWYSQQNEKQRNICQRKLVRRNQNKISGKNCSWALNNVRQSSN